MDFDASRPIWRQLVEECARRIVTGQWPVGERVPGVRDLGVELGVNPNTVQRAMSELDRQGVTVADRTKGRHVTHDADRVDTLRQELAATQADEFIRGARGLGMSLDRAQSLIDTRWNALEQEES